ncbi:hypothetical protein JCM11641_008390 [Rhodosporidiobolus odoratus]
MSEGDRSSIPETTNPAEAAHKAMLLGSGGKKYGSDAVFMKLLNVAARFETESAAVSQGKLQAITSPSQPTRAELKPRTKREIPSSYRNNGVPPYQPSVQAEFSKDDGAEAEATAAKALTAIEKG